MVTQRSIFPRRRRGFLTTELVVAMAILAGVMIPISFSFVMEGKAMRRLYFECVIMQALDGEMEILFAGLPDAVPEGTRRHEIAAEALGSAPSGTFWLSREGAEVKLEWRPDPGAPLRVQSRSFRRP